MASGVGLALGTIRAQKSRNRIRLYPIRFTLLLVAVVGHAQAASCLPDGTGDPVELRGIVAEQACSGQLRMRSFAGQVLISLAGGGL